MSVIPASLIKSLAAASGIETMSDTLASAVASDAEFRLRQLVQEAQKFVRHSKRRKLTCRDLNSALSLRNMEQLYGYASGGDAPTFRRVSSAKVGSLSYPEVKTVNFRDVLHAELPACPAAPGFRAHWLAVEGVQPTIPENPSALVISELEEADTRRRTLVHDSSSKSTGGRGTKRVREVRVKPFVRHVLSKELQLYYKQVTGAVLHGSDSIRDAVLESLRLDTGLHQLLPYLVHFVSYEVVRNLRNLDVLSALMRMTHALLRSEHLHIAPYLHQLMPAIITCVVGRRLCAEPTEDHWGLRGFAAQMLRLICIEYGTAYVTLQPRLTKTLVRAFLDPKKPLTTHYGAITGLTALGPRVVEVLVLPNVASYMAFLAPVLEEGGQRGAEAAKCKASLAHALSVVLESKGMAWDAAAGVLSSVEGDGEGEGEGDVASGGLAAVGDKILSLIPDVAVDFQALCGLLLSSQ